MSLFIQKKLSPDGWNNLNNPWDCNVPKFRKKILGCTLNAGSKGRQGSDGQDGRRLHDENSLPKFGGF